MCYNKKNLVWEIKNKSSENKTVLGKINMKIHTIEFSKILTYEEYKNMTEYVYSQNRKCYKKMYAIIYTGMNDKGIRLELYNHRVNDGAYYKLKYIITLGRYRKNDNYLELVEIRKAYNLLAEIGEYIKTQCEILPLPNECNITRIDLTKDIYVGDSIEYVIKLLNKSFTGYNCIPNYTEYKENATFTKCSSKSMNKIFELSFYDKYEEMKHHIDSGNYYYDEDMLNQAKGILRAEFRFYKIRIQGMKKSGNFKITEDLLNWLSKKSDEIIEKSLGKLYLKGAFYKLDRINIEVAMSNFKTKTKEKMIKFIKLSALHKSSITAAEYFSEEYSENDLKKIMKNFNEIGIIPTPISVRQKFEEWSFM